MNGEKNAAGNGKKRASGLSRVVALGHLTRDPELRHLPSGVAVADMGLAINESAKNGDETADSVCFVDIVAWSKQAEACKEHLTKGDCVLVEGRLQLDQSEDKAGGKRCKLRVRADRVKFLGRYSTGKGGAGGRESAEVECAIPF